MKLEEQPFIQVRNMVENARRRKTTSGQFGFHESVLQTKGQIQAAVLLLRLDLALLGDFIFMKSRVHSVRDQSDLFANPKENRKESRLLISDSISSHRIIQQVEGHIFLAQLYTLELQTSKQSSHAEDLREKARNALEESERLCNMHPSQTRGLSQEI
ncbi:hypothetical protein N7509_006493 [Penicillium cosmopolitanum]|uniref:Uncharacterized protein n=1 Tax=Penicillium cosmopolitanum TaxID=1131564 RepID=A0A9W9W0D9_9EURO|nr:uncharacterized protein N7509_006493 [Penicillium cosmopolitanum]KAJ5394706.1 hypothetical protein N7509_006493 [Penicillium cosmopolitanum]